MVGGDGGKGAVVLVRGHRDHVAAAAIQADHLIMHIRQGHHAAQITGGALPLAQHVQFIIAAGAEIDVVLRVGGQEHIGHVHGLLFKIMVDRVGREAAVINEQVARSHRDGGSGGAQCLGEIPVGHALGILHPQEGGAGACQRVKDVARSAILIGHGVRGVSEGVKIVIPGADHHGGIFGGQNRHCLALLHTLHGDGHIGGDVGDGVDAVFIRGQLNVIGLDLEIRAPDVTGGAIHLKGEAAALFRDHRGGAFLRRYRVANRLGRQCHKVLPSHHAFHGDGHVGGDIFDGVNAAFVSGQDRFPRLDLEGAALDVAIQDLDFKAEAVTVVNGGSRACPGLDLIAHRAFRQGHRMGGILAGDGHHAGCRDHGDGFLRGSVGSGDHHIAGGGHAVDTRLSKGKGHLAAGIGHLVQRGEGAAALGADGGACHRGGCKFHAAAGVALQCQGEFLTGLHLQLGLVEEGVPVIVLQSLGVKEGGRVQVVPVPDVGFANVDGNGLVVGKEQVVGDGLTPERCDKKAIAAILRHVAAGPGGAVSRMGCHQSFVPGQLPVGVQVRHGDALVHHEGSVLRRNQSTVGREGHGDLDGISLNGISRVADVHERDARDRGCRLCLLRLRCFRGSPGRLGGRLGRFRNRLGCLGGCLSLHGGSLGFGGLGLDGLHHRGLRLRCLLVCGEYLHRQHANEHYHSQEHG